MWTCSPSPVAWAVARSSFANSAATVPVVKPVPHVAVQPPPPPGARPPPHLRHPRRDRRFTHRLRVTRRLELDGVGPELLRLIHLSQIRIDEQRDVNAGRLQPLD